MISIHYGQEFRFQVSSPRRWLMQLRSLSLFCALKSQGSGSMQQVSQAAPSFYVSTHIIIYTSIYVSVCVYTCSYLQILAGHQKSKSSFLLEGMAERQTNLTEWLWNQTGLKDAENNTPVPPLAFWPTSVPLYTRRSRCPQQHDCFAAPGEPFFIRWHPTSM